MQPKLYILCRKDLPETYRAIQGGHALAQYLIDYPDTEWDNGTLIYLDGGSEKDRVPLRQSRFCLYPCGLHVPLPDEGQ